MDDETHHRSDGVTAVSGLSRKIGTLPLAVIVFYTVSGTSIAAHQTRASWPRCELRSSPHFFYLSTTGGPFGIEESVRAGGALFAILGFAIMPFIWSIPEALVTAELGSAYPEASGTVAWVEEAFGGFGGWLQGCLTWTSGATDNAIYPVLFLDYALQMFGAPDDLDPWLRFSVLSGTCLGLAYVNYRGLDVVGNMSLTVCALSMSPFVVFCLVGAFQVDPSRWLQTPYTTTAVANLDDDTGAGLLPGITLGGVLWRPFLNNLFWNLNSFDSAACFAGEIADPGRSFPKAMFGAVLMVVLGYLLPLMVALGTTNASQNEWVNGYMATVVTEAVGPWLGTWVVFAAGVSNLAMFQGEMSSDAFQILGMAERGHLPKMFAKRSRYGTPTWGIVLGAAIIMAMSVTDLSSLIEMLNFNYSV
jgi:amino acid transporter